MKSEYSSPNTLAHELIAREEQNVGLFFAAFAIQYYLHKDLLSKKLNTPLFLTFFADNDLYASQRVLIKNIIANKKYKPILEEMERLLLDYNSNSSRLPYETYLNSINKAFLIRQIFEHTDQTLSKYSFVKEYLEKEISHLDLNELDNSMWSFPTEQKILIIVRIFMQMKDSFENKKKGIVDSFVENVRRKKDEYASKNKKNGVEYANLEMFLEKFDK